MRSVYKAAFGPRYPLPPKVASPSSRVTEPLDLESYATNPRSEPDAGTRSAEPPEDDSLGAPQQPGSTDLEKSSSDSVATHHGETASHHEPSTGPSAVSVTPLPAIWRRSDSTVVKTAVKWSDVVALGSKALQPKNTSSTPKGKRVSESMIQPENTSSDSQGSCVSESKAEVTPGVVVSFSVLHAMMKVTDIIDVLMLNCPDFSTLFSLVVSCKTAKRTFEDHSQGIIKAMLERMPEELQHMTVALIAFNNSRTRNPRSIKWLMKTWLTIEPMPVMDQFANPIQTLRLLARVFSAIDLFTDVIANNCVENLKDYKTVVASRNGLNYRTVTEWSNKHPLLNQTEWSDVPDDTEWDVADLPDEVEEVNHPLTKREKYRIKRALLRYELFCSLFHLRPDRYFDTRHHPHRHQHVPDASVRRVFLDEQRLFFQQYVNPWEIGEMADITQFVFDVVRHAFFHKYNSLRYDEWRDTPGMEMPSKGWIEKNPADDDAYWGEKWMRKIGHFIWDRD